MSKVHPSVSLFTLQLLSSASYSLQSTVFSHLWLNLFPGYFKLLDAPVNGIVFLTSLLMYKNATFFLYVDSVCCNFTEVMLLISSDRCLVESFGFSAYSII